MRKRRQHPAAESHNSPSVTPEAGVHLLQQLIDRARALPGTPNIQDSDIEAWRSLARDYLVRIFGPASPNVDAVLHASGDGGLYMGVSQQEYRLNLDTGLANKIKLLQGCIEQLQGVREANQGE